MPKIVIDNLSEPVMQRLEQQAAATGRTTEEQARELLLIGIANYSAKPGMLGTRIHQRFAKYGGVELELPEREFAPEPNFFN